MPFDAGPPPQSNDGRGAFIEEPRDAEYWLDFVLRVVVVVPLLALYTWWVATLLLQGLRVLLAV